MGVVKMFLAALLAIAITACGAIKADKTLVAEADAVYADFVLGDADAVLSRLPRQFDSPESRTSMFEVRGRLIPEGPAKTAKILGQHTTTSETSTSVKLIVGYDYGERGVIFSTAWYRPDEATPWSLMAVQINELCAEHRKAFSFGSAALPPSKPTTPS